MAGVLDGSQPLQQAQSSGGVWSQIFRTNKDTFQAWKMGQKMRLFSIGRRGEDADVFFMRGFLSISTPMNDLNKNFKEYFKFVKKARKEDLKHQGRTGLRGMFKQFIDYRLWKKVFGQARDPQIAAIHQIRDFMIKKWGGKGDDFFKLDPVDPWTAGLRLMGKAFKGGGVFATMKNIMSESLKDGKRNQKLLDKHWITQKLILKGNKEKTKKEENGTGGLGLMMKRANEKMRKNKQKSAWTEKWRALKGKGAKAAGGLRGMLGGIMPMIMAAAAGIGLLIFGPKGAIAAAAGLFFLRVLPGLLWKGISGLFTGVIWLLTKAVKGIFSMARGVMKGFGKVGMKIASKGAAKFGARAVGGALGGAVLGVGMDLFDAFGEDSLGQKVGTALFGKGKGEYADENSLMGSIGKTALQALKWGAIGFLIGGPVGAAVGAAVGFLGGAVRSGLIGQLIDKFTGKGDEKKLLAEQSKAEGFRILEEDSSKIARRMQKTEKLMREKGMVSSKQILQIKNELRGASFSEEKATSLALQSVRRNIMQAATSRIDERVVGRVKKEEGESTGSLRRRRDKKRRELERHFGITLGESGSKSAKQQKEKLEALFGTTFETRKRTVEGKGPVDIIPIEQLQKYQENAAMKSDKVEDTLESIDESNKKVAQNTEKKDYTVVKWGEQEIINTGKNKGKDIL